jgi:hypothetical protein
MNRYVPPGVRAVVAVLCAPFHPVVEWKGDLRAAVERVVDDDGETSAARQARRSRNRDMAQKQSNKVVRDALLLAAQVP